MQTLDLEKLSSEAVDSVKTVLEMLKHDESLKVTEGDTLLYTLRKTHEDQLEGLVKGTYQKGDKPSDAFRELKRLDALENISAEELRQRAWAGRGV